MCQVVKMQLFAFIPFLVVLVLDSCQGAALIPILQLKGNEALDAGSYNANPVPHLGFGRVKRNVWPSRIGIAGGTQKYGINTLGGQIGGTVWQNKDKGLSMDWDLQPGVIWRGSNVNPFLNAFGDLKKTWPLNNHGLSFDLDLKPGMSWAQGNVKPSFDALGTFKWDFGK